MNKNLSKILKNTLVVSSASIGLTSFLFGFEPQFTRSWNYDGKIQSPNLEEYMTNSIEQNGNNLTTKIITYVSYPGAKAGIFLRNILY